MGKKEKSLQDHSLSRSWSKTLRVIASALVVCAAGWGLTACGSDSANSAHSSGASADSSASATSSTSTSSPEESASSTPSASASSGSSNTNSEHMACATTQLEGKLTQGTGGGAGSLYPYIVLTNTGGTCTIGGYPGVSLSAAGKQLGAAALREPGTSTTLTVQHNKSVYAQLQITQATNLPESSCKPTAADSVVIYPPNQKQAITITTKSFTGCANSNTPIIRVKALQAGTGQ